MDHASAARSSLLIPRLPACLPNAVADGEFLWDGKHHIVGYDFWNLRGLLCVADAARELGEQTDAQKFQQEADDYRHGD